MMKRKLPHDGVYARAKPSKIHGVGIFAIRKIALGTHIFPDDLDEIVWVERDAIKNLPKEIKRLYDDFSIIEDEGQRYGCPKSFNRLTMSWYLNASDKPNVGCDADYNFYALRDIREGEELTVDYGTYNKFTPGQTGRGASQ